MVRTRTAPKTFEEFVALAQVQAPAPPPGKKYFIKKRSGSSGLALTPEQPHAIKSLKAGIKQAGCELAPVRGLAAGVDVPKTVRGFHPDRTSRGDCHYCNSGSHVASRTGIGKSEGPDEFNALTQMRQLGIGLHSFFQR